MQVVSSSLYPRYLPFRIPPHQAVTVVGQVISLDEHSRSLTLQPDVENASTMNISLPESFECAELRNAKFLQVRGVSESNGYITMKEYCNLKENFDLKTYNEILRLSNDPAFRYIFGIRG